MIELARRIANHECSNPTEEDFRTVYLALYHNHLPKLDEADVVEYDTNDGTVHPGVNFNRLDRTLAQVTEDDLPWSDASS